MNAVAIRPNTINPVPTIVHKFNYKGKKDKKFKVTVYFILPFEIWVANSSESVPFLIIFLLIDWGRIPNEWNELIQLWINSRHSPLQPSHCPRNWSSFYFTRWYTSFFKLHCLHQYVSGFHERKIRPIFFVIQWPSFCSIQPVFLDGTKTYL